MSASFHNLQQEITKIGNLKKNPWIFGQELSNSQEFPPGIFDVVDSREFPVALVQIKKVSAFIFIVACALYFILVHETSTAVYPRYTLYRGIFSR